MNPSRLALLLLFSLTTLLLTSWIASAIFQHAPITTDEQSYILQAHLFAEGKLKHPAPPSLQAFRYPMIILDGAAGWFSRYPPGHSLWLAPGVWIGSLYAMTALAAALGMALTLLCAHRLGVSLIATGLALLLSPFFLFTYGTLMSHTTGFVAAAAMLLGYILWQQTGRHRWALFAGIAWSWLVLNRTYTALLIALPFAVDALWFLWKNRTLRTAWIGTACFALSALGGVFALLLYNYLTLGDPFQMTYLYYDPSDKLGFGWRHNHPVFPAPQPVEHTLAKGLSDLRANLLLLDRWLFGFPGGLIVWAALTLIGWSRRWSLLLVSSAASVALGYVLFWYPGWNATGPNYYTEAQPALVLAAAFGVTALLQRYRSRPRARAALLATAMLAWVTASLAFTITYARDKRAYLEPRAKILAMFENAPPKSLIFVKREVIDYAWPNHDLVFNPRGVNGDVIVARWLGASNGALVRYFDDYTPKSFDISEDGVVSLGPMDDEPSLRLFLDLGQQHRRTGTNLPHPEHPTALVRAANAAEHPPNWLLFGRTFSAYPSLFRVKVDLEILNAAPDDMVLTIDIAARSGREIIASRTFHGNHQREPVVFEFEMEHFLYIEPRAYFHGHGDVRIYFIELTDAEAEPGAPVTSSTPIDQTATAPRP
ncbi:MAG TPA: hypothetical protein PKE55_13520 [Kiritimatiellia bacterium]|nr:hypothetical protein [Kiritimatiellia bacterium]